MRSASRGKPAPPSVRCHPSRPSGLKRAREGDRELGKRPQNTYEAPRCQGLRSTLDRLSVVGYCPGTPATGTPRICLVSGRRKPSAPITYQGSAAAGGGGAAITDRRVLETSLCPHAVPLKMAISSVWQDAAWSRVSYARARGRGRRSRPGSGSRFLDAERERVSSQTSWLSGMWP